jgi:protein-L-isoaspartate(D-aspartate) O-methyltransferase
MASNVTETPRAIIGEDQEFQHRFWAVQRMSWAIGLGVVVAAVAGFAGAGGWLGRSHIAAADVQVSYPRAFRWDTEDSIHIRTDAAQSGKIDLTLDRQFLRDFQITGFAPWPVQTSVRAGNSRYSFAALPGQPASITLHVKPLRPLFRRQYRIDVNETKGLPRFAPLVLP